MTDIRRLWSEGRGVAEIARMTGRDRKTVSKHLRMDDFSPIQRVADACGGFVGVVRALWVRRHPGRYDSPHISCASATW